MGKPVTPLYLKNSIIQATKTSDNLCWKRQIPSVTLLEVSTASTTTSAKRINRFIRYLVGVNRLIRKGCRPKRLPRWPRSDGARKNLATFRFMDRLAIPEYELSFFQWACHGLFLFIFVLFKHKFYRKTVDFSGIRTWIVNKMKRNIIRFYKIVLANIISKKLKKYDHITHKPIVFDPNW